MLLSVLNWNSIMLSIRGILTLVDDIVHAFLETRYMKSRSRTIVFILLVAFSHSWTKSSKSGNSAGFAKCFSNVSMYFICCHKCVILLEVFDSYSFRPPCIYTLWQTSEQMPIFVPTASYLPIARCDVHYTDELIAGTLTQHQALYGQQLLHARKCNSLVYQESIVSLKVTRQLINKCFLVVSLESAITLCISQVKQTTPSRVRFWYSIRLQVRVYLTLCLT